MRKRTGLLLAMTLAAGLLVAPSPGNTLPPDDCGVWIQGYCNAINSLDVPFSVQAYAAKYFTHNGGFTADGASRAGMANAVPTATATASNADPTKCDPYPPNASSCFQYWAAARWKAPPDGGSCCTYKIEWKVIFWTNRNRSHVTSIFVSCRDHPQNGWAREVACSTGWEPYANPVVGWSAHYQYIFNACPWSVSRRDTDDIYAKVRASNQSISGTWYRYEKPIYC
jgi:hypothetical protein